MMTIAINTGDWDGPYCWLVPPDFAECMAVAS